MSELIINKLFRLFKKHEILLLFILYAGYILKKFLSYNFFTTPISQDDYSLHYANSIEVVNHILNRGVIWGYSPFFCGGKLSFGIDDFWSAMFIFLFSPFCGDILPFNISIIAGFFVPPLSVMAIMKNFNCEKNEIVLGLVLIMLGVIGMVPIRSFFYIGCYGFIIGTALCFFLLGILKRYIERKDLSSMLTMYIVGILCIFIHPLTAVIFFLLAMPFLLANRKKLSFSTLFHITGAALISIGVNFTWLFPFFRYGVSIEKIEITGMQTYPFFIFEVLKSNKSFTILSLLFIISIIKFYKSKKYTEIISWGIPAIMFSMIAFLGSQIGLGTVEPSRFIIPLIFLMMIVVASSIKPFPSRKNVIIPLLLSVFLCLIVKPMPSYSYVLEEYPVAKEILNTLSMDKKSKGRLLIQDSYNHPYFNCHFSALIPIFTNTETTANTFRLLPPVYPQFVENQLFGTTLNSISGIELAENFQIFNISHILTYSEDAREYFDTCNIVSPLRYIENFSIYSVRNFNNSPCLGGTTSVSADYTSISVETSNNPVTVLKYHYYPSLTVIPDSLSIEPVFLVNDPTPFIKVKNGNNRNFQIICKR